MNSALREGVIKYFYVFFGLLVFCLRLGWLLHSDLKLMSAVAHRLHSFRYLGCYSIGGYHHPWWRAMLLHRTRSFLRQRYYSSSLMAYLECSVSLDTCLSNPNFSSPSPSSPVQPISMHVTIQQIKASSSNEFMVSSISCVQSHVPYPLSILASVV